MSFQSGQPSREELFELLLLLAEQAPDALLLVDEGGTIRFAGGATASILGHDSASLPGASVDRFVPAEARTQHHELRNQFHAVPRRRTMGEGRPLEVVREDGSRLRVSIQLSPVAWQGSNFVLCVLRDVSEEEARRSAWQDLQRRYSDLFESSPDAIYESTAEGRIVAANPAMETLLGHDREALMRMDVRDLYVEPSQRERFRERMAREGKVASFEVALRTRDGAERVCLLSASARRDESGQIRGFQGILKDVTEQRELERRLQAREAELFEARKLEAVGELAGGIAHEFNNLLTVIQGNVELALSDAPVSEQMAQDLEEVRASAKEAARLTAHLLSFAQRQIVAPKRIDLTETVLGMRAALECQVQEGVALQLDLTPELPAVVADPGQVQQVVVSLVSNARDVTPPGGRIRIVTEVVSDGKADNVRLSVIDHGAGMTPEVRERAFEPFFTTKSDEAATGLGLSVVHGIVTQQGGRVHFDSVPGEGTAVHVDFPVAL